MYGWGVELFFLLPVVVLVACDGGGGPTHEEATTPGQATGPVEFFFKQKTAYEMIVRDGSSDVCSFRSPISLWDLHPRLGGGRLC